MVQLSFYLGQAIGDSLQKVECVLPGLCGSEQNCC